MSNRSEWKLLEKLMDKLTPEQVRKVLEIFVVNKGHLILSSSHEVMINCDGVITALNRVETVGIRDFQFVLAKVEPKVENFSEENTIVLEDEQK